MIGPGIANGAGGVKGDPGHARPLGACRAWLPLAMPVPGTRSCPDSAWSASVPEDARRVSLRRACRQSERIARGWRNPSCPQDGDLWTVAGFYTEGDRSGLAGDYSPIGRAELNTTLLKNGSPSASMERGCCPRRYLWL